MYHANFADLAVQYTGAHLVAQEQFLMAEKCYRPQMERCELVVDTTGAAVWATPEVQAILGGR